MAGEPSNLLSEIGQTAVDRTRTFLTGKPPAGSLEDVERQLKMVQAEQALAAAKRNPDDPRAHQTAIQRLKDYQALALQGQQATMEMVDNRLPTLIGATGQLADIETKNINERNRADTNNELLKIGAQREILGDTFGHELKLAEMDTGTRDAVLQFYSQAQDKNLAAQAAARKPNFMNVASLLTGLGATAAALFG